MDKTYTRLCPACGKTLTYNGKSNRNRAEKINSICSSCSHKEVCCRPDYYEKHKEFLRPKFGEENGFYGKKHKPETMEKFRNKDFSYLKTDEFRETMRKLSYSNLNFINSRPLYEVWLEKYGKEKADIRYIEYKERLSNATRGENNPMYGKPTPQGAGNGWSGWYNNYFFRSLREVSYIVNVLEKDKLIWESAEKIKIEYLDWKSEKRTYRPDFLVENKFLIEIKPSKLFKSPNVSAKAKAGEAYCKEHGLEYNLIDPPLLLNEEIAALRNNKTLKFTARYEKLFEEKYGQV